MHPAWPPGFLRSGMPAMEVEKDMAVDKDALIKDLEADKVELREMIEKASRPNVRKELLRVLDQTEVDIRHVLVHGTAPPEPQAAAPQAAPAASTPAAKTAAEKKPAGEKKPAVEAAKPAAKAPEPEHKPVEIDVRSAGPWKEITTFGLDLGGYDKPLITVDLRLKGVEALPAENVTCSFTEASFDCKVLGLDGENHRFMKTNLEKDIVPSESSVKVKKNHVIITLQKVKGQYGYDSWTDLCAKGGKRKATTEKKSDDPQDSIMGMMKDLYDDGDDNMKKIIGEAMYKARTGQKDDPKDMPKMDDMEM